MKLGLLVSRALAHEFGDRLAEGAREAGVDIEIVHLPDDPSARLAPADLARVNAAFYSRDLRFSPHADAFVESIRTAPDFRWLHLVSSGVSQYEWLPDMLARGVRASASTGSNAEPVAQVALMGLLITGRKVHRWLEGQRTRRWLPLRGADLPPDLAGRTVVVVGVGSVGRRVCRHARMLGMHVIGIRRSPACADDPVDEMLPPDALAGVLPRTDFLVLCCPLTERTRHLIDARALAALPPTASLINVARGEIVDEPALIDALANGRLASAYLDVFETEPLPADSPLWSLPNVVLSPHNASSSAGNDRRSMDFFVGNIGRFARGEPLINEVRAGDQG